MLILDDPLTRISNFLEHLFLEGIIFQKTLEITYFSTVDDENRISRFIFLVDRHLRNLPHNLHPIYHLPKYHMLPIQMWTRLQRNEKLRRVSIPPAVSHRQQSGARMRAVEVFVDEGASVDGEAALSA